MSGTELTLEILGKGEALSPFSCRECIQTLMPIPQGNLRRTINGELVYTGHSGHRKFQSSISCKDIAPPAFGELWKGTRVRIGCIQSLTQIVQPQTTQVKLERPALAYHAYDHAGTEWTSKKIDTSLISLSPSFPGGFITYSPLLVMVVDKFSLETDEWGLTVGWRLELIEQ